MIDRVRHHRPPGHLPGEVRIAGAVQHRAHRRLHAVRAKDQARIERLAAAQGHPRRGAGDHLRDRLPQPQRYTACLRRIGQQVDKVGAVQEMIGRCVRLPRQVEAWEAAARLLHRSGRHAEAIETLQEGSRKFRSRRLRPQAIHLLRRARELEAWHFEIVRDLAKLLDATRQRTEAGRLLEGLAEHTEGALLRRVRSAQFRRAPGFASFWRC